MRRDVYIGKVVATGSHEENPVIPGARDSIGKGYSKVGTIKAGTHDPGSVDARVIDRGMSAPPSVAIVIQTPQRAILEAGIVWRQTRVTQVIGLGELYQPALSVSRDELRNADTGGNPHNLKAVTSVHRSQNGCVLL